jgi:hypothetical protein
MLGKPAIIFLAHSRRVWPFLNFVGWVSSPTEWLGQRDEQIVGEYAHPTGPLERMTAAHFTL